MSVIKQGEDMSLNERAFILTALKDSEFRADGRTPLDTRPLRVTYARAEGQASAEIQLGKTRVLTVVTSELTPPYPDRPTEGFLNLSIEYSPMATLGIDNARSNPTLVEVDRVIERCLRQSRALDTEALCVIAGNKVWSLRCDVRILDDCGNVVDAACLATIAALLHFRLPEVTVLTGDSINSISSSSSSSKGETGMASASVIVHHSFEKEPSALPIHHVPICVTFGLFSDSPVLAAVDPTHREEAVMGGRLTYSINVHKELCALQKIGGLPLPPSSLVEWAEVASEKVSEWHALLQNSLEAADRQAKEERLKFVRGTASVDVLPARAEAEIVAGGGGEGGRGGGEGGPMPAGIDHLAFAELHVPIKVREGSEKPPVNVEEETRSLSLLEQAAMEAERYRKEQEEEKVAAAAVAAAAATAAEGGAATVAADNGGMDVDVEEDGVVGEKKEGGFKSSSPLGKAEQGGERGATVASRRAPERKMRKQGGKKREDSDGEDEEEEEETAVVMMSEFAEGDDDSAAGKGEGVGVGAASPGQAAASKGSASLASRRAKVTLEDMENEEDEDDGVGDDLRAAVKKPRMNRGGEKARSAISKGKGKQGGKR